MDLRRFIEHTMLKPEATEADIRKTVDQAIQYQFLGVCIAPCWVQFARTRLLEAGPDVSVRIVTVVGFPHGNNTTSGKVADATRAVEIGATEIDLVMPIGLFRSRDYEAVEADITRVAESSKAVGASAVKVILETGFLSKNEIVTACHLAESAGANFIKTSTGFGPRGSSVEDIHLISSAISKGVGIKAAGGIRTKASAVKMISAGACRIGTSSSIQIVSEAETA